MEKVFTEEALLALCADWQERLGLMHWDIGIRVSRAQDFTVGGQAEITINLQLEQALVSILDPIDYKGADVFPQDQEISLVHELLHIPFEYVCPEPKGRLEFIHLESSIERIARLLVKLKRQAVKA